MKLYLGSHAVEPCAPVDRLNRGHFEKHIHAVCRTNQPRCAHQPAAELHRWTGQEMCFGDISRFAGWTYTHLTPHYFHWFVSDATQALNLFHGGLTEVWWRWYCEAQDRTPRRHTNRGTRFEAHRAAAYAGLRLHMWDYARQALGALGELLQEEPTWHTQGFAVITHAALHLDLAHTQGNTREQLLAANELVTQIANWKHTELPCLSSTHRPLLGSWASLTGPRPSWMLLVGIHNAACALTRTEQYDAADYLFRQLEQNSYPLTAYSATLALVARWHTRQDVDEVSTIFRVSSHLNHDILARFAPKLVSIILTEAESAG